MSGAPTAARWIPTLLYMAAIFYFSSLPGPRLPLQVGASDWLVHFLEYLLLGFLLMYSLGRIAQGPGGAMAAGGIGVVYAVTDEWHQRFVPQRDGSFSDWVFDSAGVVCAVALVYALRRRKPS